MKIAKFTQPIAKSTRKFENFSFLFLQENLLSQDFCSVITELTAYDIFHTQAMKNLLLPAKTYRTHSKTSTSSVCVEKVYRNNLDLLLVFANLIATHAVAGCKEKFYILFRMKFNINTSACKLENSDMEGTLHTRMPLFQFYANAFKSHI